MARNAFGVPESIVQAPNDTGAGIYEYRNGTGMMGSFEWTHFMDDFTSSITTNLPSGWTAAIIDTGATLVASTVAVVGANGAALIASDAASEGVAIYRPKGIQVTAGEKFYMEVLVQTSLAAETDVQFGLTSLTATTNPEDLWTTTSADVIAFGTLAGSAFPQMLSDKSNGGSVVQTQTVASLADATYATMGIGYDGLNLSGYVNGRKVLTWSGAATTIPTGVALAPFVGARTGATAGNTTTFDYVRYVIQR